MFIRLINNNNLICTPDNSTSSHLTYSRKLKKKKKKSCSEERKTDCHSTEFKKWQSLKKSKSTGAARQDRSAPLSPLAGPCTPLPGSTTPTFFDLLMFLWPTRKPNPSTKASKVHFPLVILASYPVSRKLVSWWGE